MLQLEFEPTEFYDEMKEEFFYAFPWDPSVKVKPGEVFTLRLEHSLLSLSRWEEKWKIPFLSNDPEKTSGQTTDYIRFMTLTKNVPPKLYDCLTPDQVDQITRYIDDSHTATWFSEPSKKESSKGKARVITAEIIYYWMLVYNIPWDPAEKWHLHKLLTLIRVCSIENSPKKKQSRAEIADEYRRIKAARRAGRKK